MKNFLLPDGFGGFLHNKLFDAALFRSGCGGGRLRLDEGNPFLRRPCCSCRRLWLKPRPSPLRRVGFITISSGRLPPRMPLRKKRMTELDVKKALIETASPDTRPAAGGVLLVFRLLSAVSAVQIKPPGIKGSPRICGARRRDTGRRLRSLKYPLKDRLRLTGAAVCPAVFCRLWNAAGFRPRRAEKRTVIEIKQRKGCCVGTKKKQFAVNMTAQVTGFLANVAVNFFITPFIVRNIGSESFRLRRPGKQFRRLCRARDDRAQIRSPPRFITIKLHQDDPEGGQPGALRPVVLTNIILALVLALPAAAVVVFIGHLVTVSSGILREVKTLFGLIFLNFIVGIVFSTFNVATLSQNKLYLASSQTIIGNFIKVAVLLASFTLFAPHVWYFGLAALCMTVYIIGWNIRFTRAAPAGYPRPEKVLSISRSSGRFCRSGVWYSITKLSQIFSDGLDLLVANLLLGPAMMGILAVAKTVPGPDRRLHLYGFEHLSRRR